MSSNGINGFDPRKAPLESREMEWFKNLKLPLNPRQESKKKWEKRDHRAPKNLDNPETKKAKTLANKESNKKLLMLSKLHNCQCNQVLNEILKAFHGKEIKSEALQDSVFVKRSKALLKNKISLNPKEIRPIAGFSLYGPTKKLFHEIRQKLLISESFIIEKAIDEIFDLIFDEKTKNFESQQEADKGKNKSRSPKKLINPDILAKSIGFKGPHETKQKLVKESSDFKLSQNEFLIRTINWIYETIKSDNNSYDDLKKHLDNDILKQKLKKNP